MTKGNRREERMIQAKGNTAPLGTVSTHCWFGYATSLVRSFSSRAPALSREGASEHGWVVCKQNAAEGTVTSAGLC